LKTKSLNKLPKTPAEILNGGVYQQLVRCGKSNCRCASGDLHKGYYYYIRRVNGRQRKTYVPKQEVQAVSKLVRDSRAARQVEKSIQVSNDELLATLREQMHGNDSVIKNLADSFKGYD
jgi:hypothetical protein